jgi:hypothetical protein
VLFFTATLVPQIIGEMIESSLRKGYRFADIMRRKSRKPDEAEMSLRNWIITRSPNLGRRKPGDLIEKHRAWFEERLAQLQAWGFGATPLISSAEDVRQGETEEAP